MADYAVPVIEREDADLVSEAADVTEGRVARKSVRELTPREIGVLGEDMAASYLERKGWRLLERNWRSRFGEADIIAEDAECGDDGDSVVLVEVKTRLALGEAGEVMPELAVDARKRDRYKLIGLCYIVEHPHVDHLRFDVIALSVVGEGQARLRHLCGAFSYSD